MTTTEPPLTTPAVAVRWSEVDGVPVAWVPSSSPDLSAQLLFRVGKADEGLAFNGITHLVEHLSLFGVGRPPHYMNGSVSVTTTCFSTSGSPDEVVRFFDLLVQSLRHLPTERREAEARVLATEHSRRGSGLYDALSFWRYGLWGAGLSGADEHACVTMSGPQLQAWADQRLTRQNAVLVLDGPPPAGLRLGLADGQRFSAPPLSPLLRRLPGWFQHEGSDLAMSAVVSRGPGVGIAQHCLNDALVKRLRHELAVAYSPRTGLDEYDADTSHLVLVADSHHEHSQRAFDATLETLETLARRGPDAVAFAEARRTLQAVWSDPAAAAGWAGWEARKHLLGAAHQPAAEHLANALSAVPENVAALAAQVMSSALWAVPRGTHVLPQHAAAVPTTSTGPVLPGTPCTPAPSAPTNLRPLRRDAGSLTVSGHHGSGVSVVLAECVGVLAWPDGARELINRDGSAIHLDPAHWAEGAALVEQVDAATAAVRIPQQARELVTLRPPPTPQQGRDAAAADGPSKAPVPLLTTVLVGGGGLLELGGLHGALQPGTGSGASFFLLGTVLLVVGLRRKRR